MIVQRTGRFMEERKPFSGALSSLIILIIVVSLVIQPTWYRPSLFLLVLGIAHYLLFYTTTGDVIADVSIASAITPYVATAFDFIILTEPQTQLFRLGQTAPSASFPSIWQKVKWALDLLSSPRGIGWSHEPSKLPPAPFTENTSRLTFIANQLYTVAVYYLMWDVCAIYAQNTPALLMGGPPLSEQPVFRKCLNVWAWVIPGNAALSISHCLLSVVMVGLGVWPDIAQWRPLFGSYKEAYTVRRLWSQTWHQLIRRVLTSPGYKLREYFSIPKGSHLSSYTLLYVSFFMSAWIHRANDYMMLNQHGGALEFFVSQALFITFEDFVIAQGKRLGFTDSQALRILGYAWVQLWFAYSLPWWLQPQISGGLLEDLARSSLILKLWNGN